MTTSPSRRPATLELAAGDAIIRRAALAVCSTRFESWARHQQQRRPAHGREIGERVIGPFDFLMLRSGIADELESVIDAAIRRAVAWRLGPITLSAKGWAPDTIETVLDRYRAKGWKAELLHDVREGDFIQLDVPS